MGQGSSPQQADRKPPPLADLRQVRLLIALDALLRLGSVGRAAASLGLHVSAMSRHLTELRQLYDDQLFVRTGQGMTPTPFAEGLRKPVRALVTEAEKLLAPDPDLLEGPQAPDPDGWEGETVLPLLPLSITRANGLEASPTPHTIAQRIAGIGESAEPLRRLAKYIAVTAAGAGKSRSLNKEEAEDAFRIILQGAADPVQIGALLTALQYRGVTAVELAGFVAAVRPELPPPKNPAFCPDLDWPAYLSANCRQAPWFIHAARLVASAGFRVALHGFFGNGADSGKLETAAADAGIPVCQSLAEGHAEIASSGIVYLPLGALAPGVQSLLGLYALMETRNPVHLVPHLINPLRGAATLLGAAQLSKRDTYRDVAQILGRRNVTVLGSIRDFAQVNPRKTIRLHRIVDGTPRDEIIQGRDAIAAPPLPVGLTQREYWNGVWTGAARDPLAEATILATAAVALQTLSGPRDLTYAAALEQAEGLWAQRRRHP